MKLSIIGTGYVGLVTGTCFAEMGHDVICLDIDTEKIKKLQQGIPLFFEPGLKELILRNQKAKRLHFTAQYKSAIERSDMIFIAVGTPPLPDGSADVSHIKDAALAIAEHINGYKVIINKSTAPVGTAEWIQTLIQETLDGKKMNHPFDVVSSPEFLKEGSAIEDCMKPDRIIIGSQSEKAIQLLKTLYSSFTLNHDRILIMDPKSAELTKYAANAFLAMRISFMNEIAEICEKVGANIHKVRKGIGADHRIGYHFLYAGLGFGGSCFPKDLCALQAMARYHKIPTPILKAIYDDNMQQREKFYQKIINYFSSNGGIKGKTVAIWGLSFKPDTDDVREAPALTLIVSLLKKSVNVRLFDPIAMKNAKKILPKSKYICYSSNEYHAATSADAIILCTEWKQFRSVNLQKVLTKMRGNAFFDGRNQYEPKEMEQKGFIYFGIGVPTMSKVSLDALISKQISQQYVLQTETYTH